MSVIKENLDNLESALANLENVVKKTRKVNMRVRNNLGFADDLTDAQRDFRLAKIDPFAAEIQEAFSAAKVVFQATDPIIDSN